MRKLLLLLIFSISIFATNAKEVDVAVIKERERLARQINRTLQKSTVTGKLGRFVQDISQGGKDGKPLHSLRYTIIVASINSWLKYRWFIADTGLSKKWLKKVHALFAYMAKNKRFLDAAKFNGRLETPKAKLAVKYQKEAYDRLVKLVKEPVRVTSKYRRKMQAKKVMWQKAMRKKYKIKDKIQEDF